ncbi:efflux RND transporter periplasmic adaptor subunit, partial [Delftia tsuruhatensis]
VMLAKLDVMTVRAEIAEADVDKIQLGQTVWFTTLGSGRQRHTATIERIEPAPASIATDATAGAATATGAQAAKAIYYNAQFDVPNPEGKLRPSMTAQVTVRVAQADKAVLMPAAALGSRDADDNYSVRVRDAQGQVTERKVRVGLRTNAQAQVLSGLEPGEQVVIGEASPGGKPAGSDPMGM